MSESLRAGPTRPRKQRMPGFHAGLELGSLSLSLKKACVGQGMDCFYVSYGSVSRLIIIVDLLLSLSCVVCEVQMV